VKVNEGIKVNEGLLGVFIGVRKYKGIQKVLVKIYNFDRFLNPFIKFTTSALNAHVPSAHKVHYPFCVSNKKDHYFLKYPLISF